MIVRTYEGKTVEEAIASAKADLGENAMVLTSRRVSKGLLRSYIELTAALSPTPELNTNKLQAELAQIKERTESVLSKHARDARNAYRMLSPLRGELRVLRNEIRQLKDKRQTDHNTTSNGDRVVERLLRRGLSPQTAETIVETVERRVRDAAITANTHGDLTVAHYFTEQLSCLPPLDVYGTGHVAFVGPPRVGKTTLIAGVAARAALIEDRRVALASCLDTSLVARRHLQAIGKAIGIPCLIADTPVDLRARVSSSDLELVLIDLPGVSLSRATALNELRSLLEEVDFHLVLAAGTTAAQAAPLLKQCIPCRVTALSFTKLDQTCRPGMIYEALTHTGLPASFLTNGPRVPEDLFSAQPHELARLILGNDVN